MPNTTNTGVAETIIGSLAGAVDKAAGKKNGACIIAMAFLYAMQDAPWGLCVLVAALGGSAVALQFALDFYERYKLGKDLPDSNGSSDPEAKPPEVIP
jgi:hypothetical protein